MATAKELRVWAATVRKWVERIEDTQAAQYAAFLAMEMDCLAERKEVADRQFV